MSDQSIGKQVQQLFSPPVLAALRYALTAISPVLAIVGWVALSPQKIDTIINLAQQIGVVVGAIAALIGVIAPIAAGIFGTFKSTQAQQVQSVKDIAVGPASPVAQSAQKALIEATHAVAMDPTIPTSTEAKNTLIAATIALPEVQTIVADKATAEASPSGSVVAAEEPDIIQN